MISNKQRKMLAFIESFVDKNGYPPTYEEIRAGLDISTKSLVNHHLAALQNAELLTRAAGSPRSIRLLRQSGTVKTPPFEQVDGVSPPAFSELDSQQVIELTFGMVPDGDNLYALKVQRGSMLDALVNEGDILILQSQTVAQNGELVAVRLANQDYPMFRRYFRENGHVRLQPENPTIEPLIVNPDAVEVEAKVVAVIRQIE